jgi:hypothetical protein
LPENLGHSKGSDFWAGRKLAQMNYFQMLKRQALKSTKKELVNDFIIFY